MSISRRQIMTGAVAAGAASLVVRAGSLQAADAPKAEIPVLKNEDFARDVQTLPGTAAVVNAVSKDAASIGYGGIAYAKEIRAVPVSADASSRPVQPSLATVQSGEYPLSRNLYFYTVGEPSGEAKAFIDWVLSAEGQQICEAVGYYPLKK